MDVESVVPVVTFPQQQLEGGAFTLYKLLHSGSSHALTPAEKYKSMSPNIRTQKTHVLPDGPRVGLVEGNSSSDHQDDGVGPWSTE